MATPVEICNMALGHLAAGEIASLDERSPEAAACNRFYDVSLEATLRAFDWKCARRTEALALVEEEPTLEWLYSYRTPAGCLAARRIPSGVVPEPQESRIPFEMASDDAGDLIYTDQPEAELEFTKLVEDTSKFPSDLVLAHSLYLASLIAPSVTRGDPYKLGERALARFQLQIGKAEVASARERQARPDPDSEFIRVRG
jgi:hypothetical protein